ncbi:COR domain-containing protein [Methylomagnum ishizawai]|uniref:COR domain-containing protein n=1 Tax=Methylomagnum ishizawai TaxID=1760988 RepID=UPI001C32826B|nr:COR domain-containing protein [Methylomagnum ishizawai]BBL74198.1 hypothetical protein MishRS11D_12960 [Methylomagnum ishizawai]
MSIEEQKKEILRRIRELPPEQAAAVAVRAAMRVVPVLAGLTTVTFIKARLFARIAGKKSQPTSVVPREDSIFLILWVFRANQCADVDAKAADDAKAAAKAAAKADAAAAAAAKVADDDAAKAADADAAAKADADADATADAYDAYAYAYAYAATSAAAYTAYAVARAAAYAAYAAVAVAVAVAGAGAVAAAAAAAAADAAYAAAKVAAAADDDDDDDVYAYAAFIFSSVNDDLARLAKGVELSGLPLWPEVQPLPPVFAKQWRILQAFMLELDPGFQYWIDWYEARLRGERVIWEEIRDQVLLPEEILKQEVPAINAYLLKLRKRRVVSEFTTSYDLIADADADADADDGEEVRPLNRVRAILIGPGGAGKTSLLRALHGEPVVKGEERMTPGVEIRESCLDARTGHYRPATEWEDSPIVHFWDFGGQVMYHATHQFFLRSNCVYILVLDGRSAAAEGNEADYWLEHVRAFAPQAPVLLVGNKSDQALMEWNQSRLCAKYPNIWPGGFYQLACSEWTDERSRHFHAFAGFKRDLQDALHKVGTVQVQFSPEEFQVLGELRRRSPKETFLPKADYQRLCEEKKLRADPKGLLDLLDSLGVILHFPHSHFPHLGRLNGYLLNPRWLTYGVYEIITRKHSRVGEADAFAWLAEAEVTDNLGNQLDYPWERCGYILDAMVQFKVAYRDKGNSAYLQIPSLLPTQEPELDFPESQARAFRFRFEGLLPPQLLSRLIVERHADIDRGKVWRHGVLLRTANHGGARALLRGDAHYRTLTLWVIGAGLDRYFAVLYQEVKDILGTMPELPYEELIRLPNEAWVEQRGPFGERPGEEELWASWINVLHASLDGEVFYREKGVKYDLKKVLGIMTEDERKSLEAGLTQVFYVNQAEQVGVQGMGDIFNIKQSQVGAAGSQARADHNNFYQQNQSPALDELGELLGQLLADLQAAKSEVAAFEVETAIRTLNDVRSGKEQGKGWLKHFLSNIKNNVGPVADGISVIAAASDAATKYGPGLVAVVGAALQALGG